MLAGFGGRRKIQNSNISEVIMSLPGTTGYNPGTSGYNPEGTKGGSRNHQILSGKFLGLDVYLCHNTGAKLSLLSGNWNRTGSLSSLPQCKEPIPSFTLEEPRRQDLWACKEKSVQKQLLPLQDIWF